MTHYTKAITLSMLVVLLLVAVLPISAVLAEQTAVGFDGTSVLEDLQGATILGEEFDSRDYNYNANGAPELLAFTEFAFSFLMEYQTQYALYLYIYFPQGGLVASEELNQVNMAVEYNSLGEPSKYVKFPLRLLNWDMEQVLYKFKVLDDEKYSIVDVYKRVAQQPTERRYDISSIELYKPTEDVDEPDVVDYGIGGSWTITGYGKGMHASSMEQSTLESVATFENTLRIDAHPTYFRTWNNLLNTVGDQLSSVYFSVPNSIDKEYDRLYAIDFEAYKYLSSPIFCIYDKWYPFIDSIKVNYDGVYQNLYNQRAKPTSEFESLPNADYTWLRWCNYDDASFAFYGNSSPYPPNDMYVYLDKLAWVLQTSNEKDHKFSSKELLTYMQEFTEKFGCPDGEKYSSLLFSDRFYAPLYADLSNKVFTGANIGRTITYDNTWPIDGSLTKYDFGDVLNLIFKHTQDSANIKLSPIQEVTWTAIKNLTDEQISQTYFVAESDVSEFKYYVKNENSLNKSVYLFRYDMESFYTEQLYAENLGICGYVWQEPIYLDFDIISLTYDKVGVKTVIPVVSDPIDIIAGIEPPTDGFELEIKDLFSGLMTNFLTVVFGGIALVVFVFVLYTFLKYILTNK